MRTRRQESPESLRTEHHLLKTLLATNAVPQGSVCPLSELDETIEWHSFVELGFLQELPVTDGIGLQLTDQGMQKVSLALSLHSSRNLLAVRPGLPLLEMTLLELIVSSLEDGWSWQPLPKMRSARARLSYASGADKVAYFSQTSAPHKLYVVCLLRSADLCEQGVRIPHWVEAPARVCVSAKKFQVFELEWGLLCGH